MKRKLLDMVVIILFAKLANADDWKEMADFVIYYEDLILQFTIKNYIVK